MTSSNHSNNEYILPTISKSTSKGLDSIRGLSAFIVVFGHAYQFIISPVDNSYIKYVGLFTQAAVMIFFVLSGFFIGRSLINNQINNHGFNLFKYSMDRVLRLYPALIYATLLCCALWYLAPVFFESGTREFLNANSFSRSGYILDRTDVLGSLFFINGFVTNTPSANGPLWSLPYEAWYYVLGASVFLMRGRSFISAIFVMVFFFITYENSQFFIYMPVWLSGFLVALSQSYLLRIRREILFFFFISLCVWSAYLAHEYLTATSMVYASLQEYVRASGLAFCSFMILMLSGNAVFTSKLSGSSKYSYTLYLIHMPIMLFFFGCFQSYITSTIYHALASSFVIIFVSAVLSFYSAKVVENRSFFKSFFKTSKV